MFDLKSGPMGLPLTWGYVALSPLWMAVLSPAAVGVCSECNNRQPFGGCSADAAHLPRVGLCAGAPALSSCTIRRDGMVSPMFHENMHLRELQQGVGRAHATSPAAAIGDDGAAAIGDEQPLELVADSVLPAGVISGMQAGITDALHCATFGALPHAALCYVVLSAASAPREHVLFASRCPPMKRQVRWSSVCEAA